MDTLLFDERLQALGFKAISCKKMLQDVPVILQSNEELLGIAEGTMEKIHNEKSNDNGLLLLTNTRIIFYRRSILNRVTREDIPLHKVTSASFKKGLLRASLIVTSANDMAEITVYDKNRVPILADKINSLINQPIKQDVKTESKPDKYHELEKLFELKSKGILSEEEFAEQKAKLLTQ